MSPTPAQLFRDFAAIHLAPAEHPLDIIGQDCLEGRFRRWGAARCFRGEFPEQKQANGLPWSMSRAAKRIGIHRERLVRGEREDVFYVTRWVDPLEPAELARREQSRAERRVIDQVLTTEPLLFVDGTVEAGATLDQLSPTSFEQRSLDELYAREGKHFGSQARPWIVVLVKDRRRIARSSCFRRA